MVAFDAHSFHVLDCNLKTCANVTPRSSARSIIDLVEDLANHRGLRDRRDHAHLPTAPRAAKHLATEMSSNPAEVRGLPPGSKVLLNP
jgi:hypothetical protein